MLYTLYYTVHISWGGAGCLDAPKVSWRKWGMREKVISGIVIYNLIIRHLQSSNASSLLNPIWQAGVWKYDLCNGLFHYTTLISKCN